MTTLTNAPKPYRITKIVNRWVVQKRRGSDYVGLVSHPTYAEAVQALSRMTKAPEPLKKGDIFHWSWGYDQTNADFFEVVHVSPSGKTVKVREVATEEVYDGPSMTGKAVPVKGKYTSEPMTKRPAINTSSAAPSWYLPQDFGWCSLWDGTPMTFSTYA